MDDNDFDRFCTRDLRGEHMAQSGSVGGGRDFSAGETDSYSWKLLDQAAQEALMQLAVFRGGGSREAVQIITGTSLQTLMRLVNKSLLARDPETGRYFCHTLLQQYAENQLEQAGLTQKTHDRHSQYYLNFMYERHTILHGQNPLQALDQFEADMGNIRTAWSHAMDMKHYDLIQRAMTGLLPRVENNSSAKP